MNIIDLSGEWLYETDEKNEGILQKFFARKLNKTGFVLPGSACENKVGKKQEYYDEFVKEAVKAPREKYEYINPLWLQKTVIVPKSARGKSIRLFIERVNIASMLWVDGVQIGRQIIELSAPHIYDLTDRIAPGEHTITLMIDNRNIASLNYLASGYSIDTQGYWSGAIGRIEIQIEDRHHIGNVQIYPNENGIRIKLPLTSTVYNPYDSGLWQKAKVYLNVITPEKEMLGTKEFEVEMCTSNNVFYLEYDILNIRYWDEFDPCLYNLNVRVETWGETDEKDFLFGMRTIKTEGRKIILNGNELSLRGTTDCAIYPVTGYPPMDIEVYRKNFRIIKSYGLNYVRFHAWCPPECAFCAADEIGIYVSVEMPMWLNRAADRFEVGDDPIHRSYFTAEAINISKAYGNHPSFIMFSNGNELGGDFELLDDIITQVKSFDNRRIYTITSNCDHKLLPCEDYFCASDVNGRRIRIQDMYDKIAESTCNDYCDAVDSLPIPVVSFEVGQYCVYPDVNVIEKYTGNMLPVNFDAIKKNMIKAGVYDKLDRYIEASGRLALSLYKEDIESALRTKDFGGFGLLSISDYTGQSTAAVGMLDAFFEEKGFTSAEEFRGFCGSVVPLLKAKRFYYNTDSISAELDLYDFGKKKIENPMFEISVYNGNKLVYKTETLQRHVDIPISGIKKPAMLNVAVSVGKYTNQWTVFAYDDNETDMETISDISDIKAAIESGKSAVITLENLKKPIKGNFVPVFWSPVHFPTDKACGAMIDAKHNIFDKFPTGEFLDYQWKDLMENAKCAEISAFGSKFKAIIETVPNYVKNNPSSPLFEVCAGDAKLLFCGCDLNRDDVVTKQLKRSICDYVKSGRFKPRQSIEADKITELFE